MGAIWMIAAVAKLLSTESASQAVEQVDFLDARLARPFGLALPAIEMTLGMLLLAGAGIIVAAWTSLLLLAAFTLVITLNLLRGRRFECQCFGQLGRVTISWWSVTRNLLLIAVSLIVALNWVPYVSLDHWRQAGRVLTGDPPVLAFLPILLIAISVVIIWLLSRAAWQVAKAIAHADDGPALEIPERRHLRRWLGLRETTTSGPIQL
jgi:hypothetical protein